MVEVPIAIGIQRGVQFGRVEFGGSHIPVAVGIVQLELLDPEGIELGAGNCLVLIFVHKVVDIFVTGGFGGDGRVSRR